MPSLYVKVKELRYAGKSYRYGDRFEASEKDAAVLKLIGKAADKALLPPLRVSDPQPVRAAPEPEQSAPPEPEQQQASMLPEGEGGDSEPTTTGRRRRRYMRSDMRSED